MPAANNSASNHGQVGDDDKNSVGSGTGGEGSFNNGLWNADNGFQSAASAAFGPPAGAGDPPADATFASIPTLADYLVSGYWAYSGYGGTDPRHFDHNTISVNITELTAAEQTIAQLALSLWHDVADVSFTFTSGSADITYNNDGSGQAFTTYSSVSNGHIANSTVHISSDWDVGAAGGNYSYFFQTYVHETGHALGLGHQGPYNSSATYGVDNLYTNDTWRWSVMSYFAQNNYGTDTYDYALTPQMADIYAIQSVYGAQTATRTGNTVYGFNSNAGDVFNFTAHKTPAFTIYDSGGTDSLDASGFSSAQTIDLTPGNWSSIGGYTNNIGIYTTTIIENAYGGSGNDTITGNAANNVLYGAGGADVMAGGAGNDTYYVDNIGDSVIEASNAGTDLVNSSISYTLGSNVENLILNGSANINGTGNSLANTLTGNSGNNVLYGAGGADAMAGGAGNDTYYVDNSGDSVTEASNSGTDLVNSSISYTLGNNVEKLILNGSANINGTGNSLANTVTGNSGNNVIDGAAGNDTLTGGGGQDTFLFGTALTANVDTVADFDASNDTIRLDQSIFTAITTLGTLSAAAFFTGAAAHDADDRIIYNAATGNLFYDSDGTGATAAVQFAHLNGAPAIGNTNFTVVA
jgi:serralysin